MKTCPQLWKYHVEFFLDWKTFQTKVAYKNKIHVLCPVTSSRKWCHSWDNDERHDGAREAATDNMAAHSATRAQAQAHAHARTSPPPPPPTPKTQKYVI